MARLALAIAAGSTSCGRGATVVAGVIDGGEGDRGDGSAGAGDAGPDAEAGDGGDDASPEPRARPPRERLPPPTVEELEWRQEGGTAGRSYWSRAAWHLHYETLWTLPLDNWTTWSSISPVVAGNTVVVPASKLHAFDAISGDERWATDYPPAGGIGGPGPSYVAHALAGDRVVVAGFDGPAAYAVADGSLLWHRAATPLSPEARSITVHGGLAFAPFADVVDGRAAESGRVLGLDVATGETVWEAVRARRPSNVAVARGRVLVVDAGGNVAAFSRESAAPLWSTNVGGVGAPRVLSDGPRAIAFGRGGDGLGRAVVLDAADGRELWRSGAIGGNGLVAAYGLLFLSDKDGSLVAREITSGDLWWRSDTLGWPVAAADGAVLVNGMVGQTGNALLRLDAETGAVAGPPISTGFFGPPALSCGRVYGGVRDFGAFLRGVGDPSRPDACPASEIQ